MIVSVPLSPHGNARDAALMQKGHTHLHEDEAQNLDAHMRIHLEHLQHAMTLMGNPREAHDLSRAALIRQRRVASCFQQGKVNVHASSVLLPNLQTRQSSMFVMSGQPSKRTS